MEDIGLAECIKHPDWLDITTISIAILSFIVSIITYSVQKKLQTLFFARQSSEFLAQAVFSLDQIYINNPNLWSIYDKSNQDKEKGRFRALGLYYFNMFQMAYDLYQDARPRNDKRSRNLWRGWDSWLRNFLKSSTFARSLWEENRQFYEEKFRQHVDNILQECTQSE